MVVVGGNLVRCKVNQAISPQEPIHSESRALVVSYCIYAVLVLIFWSVIENLSACHTKTWGAAYSSCVGCKSNIVDSGHCVQWFLALLPLASL